MLAKTVVLFCFFHSLWSELLGCTYLNQKEQGEGEKADQERHLYGEIKNCVKLGWSGKGETEGVIHINKNVEVWSRCRSMKKETEFFFVRDRKLHHVPSPKWAWSFPLSAASILSQPLHEWRAAALPPLCSRKASGNKQHLALLPRQRHCFFNNMSLWKPSPDLLQKPGCADPNMM